MIRLCRLCGDHYHEHPDEEPWMGLICPGATASEDEGERFLSLLAQAYAHHITAEITALNSAISERRRLWYERVRIDVPQEQMQADCDWRTEAEITRQKRDEVWQAFGEFEVDLPHLTIPGKIPQGAGTYRQGDVSPPEDWSLYIEPEDM